MTATDILKDEVKGYPKLAAAIELFPELGIYRKFGALNSLNLLYLQAELEDLEEELRRQQKIDDEDKTGKGKLFARDWRWLRNSETTGNSEQLQLVLRIRATTKEYSESVTVISTIFIAC